MNYSDLTDKDLIARFKEGETICMEILINRHKSKVYSYILMIVKNNHVADDLFQDTFINVMRFLKTGSYVDNGKFVGWVMRIAHNLTIDYFRKEKKLNLCSSDDEKYNISNSTKYVDSTIEDKIVDEQILSEVKDMIEYLPEEQKQVVLLHHYAGMSFKDIAELTGVSINTALGRMRYALINLRKIIEKNKIVLIK